MDSPTANMFNNLSPIKLISSMSSSQAFDNIDVPSPQPVFATPQSCTMKSKRWKRFQILTSSVLQNSFQEDAVHIAESLEYPDINDHCFPMPAAQSNNCSYKDSMDVDNTYICDHHSHNQLCRSPSSGVNDFLSIPFEDCGNISGSSSMLMGEDDGLICDKEVLFVSSSGDNMTCPSNAFVQVPLIKSASMVTNFVAECTDHSKLVSTATMDQNKVLCSTATMDQNKVILPETFQNSYALHEGSGKELLVSNIGESFDFNVIGQISPYNPDKNLYTKKASQQTESASFEEIGTGGTLDKALEVNLISSLPSISSAEHEPIAIDRDGTDHSVVPSNTSCNSANHEVVCNSISSSCFLGKHEGNLYSSWKDYLSQLDHYIDTDCEKIKKTSNGNHNNSTVMRDVSVNSQIPNDQEDAVYHSRCMYKRLLFENIEKHEPSIAYNANSMNLESSLIISNAKIDGLQASNANTNTISERVMALQPTSDISCNYSVKPDSSDQNKGISSAIILKSSGIGLHLNAIGVSGQMSSHLNAEKPMNGSNRGGKTLLRPSCEVQSQVLKNMSVSGNADGEVSDHFISKLDDSSFGSKGECKNERSKNLLDSIPDCSSPNEVISLNMHMQHDFNDHHLTPCGRKCLPSEEAIKSEDSTQSSLRKKRRKASEIEGQKHCSCKRSKCLKLYCDCFAAGLFCNEACGCQVCFNKSEHEEMVSSTRQLIETRNPLAFAPRVVQANGDLKENADNKHITPPSARHKRGCNCKRSKCLKKYCECFQAGVGCSLGCRCEGCRNAFGTKEAYGDVTEIAVEHQKPKDDALSRESSAKSLEVTDGKAKLFNAKQFNGCFTPPTSLVQGTKSRLQICASYHSISDSNLTALTSLESPTSTMNLKSESPHVEKCEDPLSIVTYQQLDSCSASMFSSPTPQWNGFTSTGNINPSSAPSSAQLGVSLQQPRSPVLIKSHFGEENFSNRSATTTGSDYNLAEETPDILKNDHSPIRTVKVSSPNKKRVSPPKNMGSCFSPGLKSGRKYVLQSISQFPSLTPYRNNLKDESTTGSLEEQG